MLIWQNRNKLLHRLEVFFMMVKCFHLLVELRHCMTPRSCHWGIRESSKGNQYLWAEEHWHMLTTHQPSLTDRGCLKRLKRYSSRNNLRVGHLLLRFANYFKLLQALLPQCLVFIMWFCCSLVAKGNGLTLRLPPKIHGEWPEYIEPKRIHK